MRIEECKIGMNIVDEYGTKFTVIGTTYLMNKVAITPYGSMCETIIKISRSEIGDFSECEEENCSTLSVEIDSELKKISDLFKKKNDQYATSKDDLSNFTLGGKLIYNGSTRKAQYEALKSYVLKHIAHVYANEIDGKGVDESMGDIATYAVIAMVMIKRFKESEV